MANKEYFRRGEHAGRYKALPGEVEKVLRKPKVRSEYQKYAVGKTMAGEEPVSQKKYGETWLEQNPSYRSKRK